MCRYIDSSNNCLNNDVDKDYNETRTELSTGYSNNKEGKKRSQSNKNPSYTCFSIIHLF